MVTVERFVKSPTCCFIMAASTDDSARESARCQNAESSLVRSSWTLRANKAEPMIVNTRMTPMEKMMIKPRSRAILNNLLLGWQGTLRDTTSLRATNSEGDVLRETC